MPIWSHLLQVKGIVYHKNYFDYHGDAFIHYHQFLMPVNCHWP